MLLYCSYNVVNALNEFEAGFHKLFIDLEMCSLCVQWIRQFLRITLSNANLSDVSGLRLQLQKQTYFMRVYPFVSHRASS